MVYAHYSDLVPILEEMVGPLLHSRPIVDAYGIGWSIQCGAGNGPVHYLLTVVDDQLLTLLLLKIPFNENR